MTRTVLVTGGTGYLGQFVVQAFLDAGDRVGMARRQGVMTPRDMPDRDESSRRSRHHRP